MLSLMFHREALNQHRWRAKQKKWTIDIIIRFFSVGRWEKYHRKINDPSNLVSIHVRVNCSRPNRQLSLSLSCENYPTINSVKPSRFHKTWKWFYDLLGNQNIYSSQAVKLQPLQLLFMCILFEEKDLILMKLNETFLSHSRKWYKNMKN